MLVSQRPNSMDIEQRMNENFERLHEHSDRLGFSIGTISESNNEVRTTITEKVRVERRLNGFNYKQSEAWKLICAYISPNLGQKELLGIAQVISRHTKLKLDRQAKRSKEVLIKWFQENLEIIRPYLIRITLEDEHGNVFRP